MNGCSCGLGHLFLLSSPFTFTVLPQFMIYCVYFNSCTEVYDM